MNKKVLLQYVFMYLPFVVGIVLFSCGIVNLFSSLLLFCGGYVAIKNTFDFRKVRKNIDVSGLKKEKTPIKVNVEKVDTSKKVYIKSMNPENIVGIKRTRVYKRVRSRIR